MLDIFRHNWGILLNENPMENELNPVNLWPARKSNFVEAIKPRR